LSFGEAVGAHLLPLYDPGALAVSNPHALGGADLLALDLVGAHRRALVALRLDHAELARTPALDARFGTAAALDSGLGMAAALESEGLAARPLCRMARAALHPECRTIAAAALRADARSVAAVASARGSKGRMTAAMSATVSAGLRARRHRNRQCGDARGKEQPGHHNSPLNTVVQRAGAPDVPPPTGPKAHSALLF
jgi:hypothetical protein